MMEFRDYYKILGVKKMASADEIKKAFRKLARKYHPDINQGDTSAEARFKELNEAHEVLSNPETRRKYDTLGQNWKQYENAPRGDDPFGAGGPFTGFGGGPGGGVRWNLNTGAPGARSMSEDEVRDMFGENPFSDFFQTFFGRKADTTGPGSDRATRRRRDIEHPLELSLEQAFHGVTQRLAIRDAGGNTRSVEVRIPAGVNEGSRVRVAGQAKPWSEKASSGDIYLRIQISPHSVFERRGNHLYVQADISVTTAVLGGHVEVPTIDGTPIRLKIPAMTQQGRVFRVKGKGIPERARGAQRGHLHVTVQVMLPKKLTPEMKVNYEALAALEGTTESKTRKSRTSE